MPSREDETSRYASVFASALMDPRIPTPAMVQGPAERTAANRYNVYRNNVMVSLIDALAATFSAVQRITGTDFFRAMARQYIRFWPPSSPLLFEYGRNFPAFIQNYEYAQSMPWLADVACIERAWLDAYHAADAEPLKPDAFAAIPPDRLADAVFVLHPAARIVRSSFSAVTIFSANRREGMSGLIDASTPEDALITRPDADVVVRHLTADAAMFLTGLMEGRPLGEAAAWAMEASSTFDLAANIAGFIRAGVFVSVVAREI